MSVEKQGGNGAALPDNSNELILLDKWQKVVDLLAQVSGASAGFLVQYQATGFKVIIASRQISNPYPAGTEIAADDNIFCRKVVETRAMLYVPDARQDPCWATNPGVSHSGLASYLGVPIFWPDGRCFGTLCVMDDKKTAYQPGYIELIHQLKAIIEADLVLLELYDELQQLAHQDELCRIYNRRGFKGLAQQRIKLAQRNATRLALLYIDVDNFKEINDGHGHLVGDQVLKLLADIIKQSIRSTDILGRIGGDEFVVLLMCQRDEDVQITKEHIMQGLSRAISDTCLPRISITIGHQIAGDDVRLDTLLAQADEDMFRRKQARRHAAAPDANDA